VVGLALAVVGVFGCEPGAVEYEAVPDGGNQEDAASDITVICDTQEDRPHLWHGRTDSGKVTVQGDRITMENATIEVGDQGAEVQVATADFPSHRCMVLVDMDVRIFQ
jgi:hypothetical protein